MATLSNKNTTVWIMLFAPIISLCILTLGNGFFVTLTTIQLKNLHEPDWIIGLVSAAYFAGMMVASYRAQRFIIRVGHIRSYAAFASLIAVSSLIQGLTENTILWFLTRYMCGYAIAGLFIIIESWCIEGSSPGIKGRVFAFYLFSYYLAQALGQLFLKIHYSSTLIPFCIIAAVSSISVLPVTMTRFEAPKLEMPESFSPWKYSRMVPLGIFGGLIAGLVLSGIYTIMPLTFKNLGFSVTEIAYLMCVTILGGAVLQIPIGKISDIVDRRIVIAVVTACCALLSLILAFVHQDFWVTTGLVFLLGGVAFVIYPLSISHATDYVSQSNTIAVLSTMSLAYGVGSTAGPVLISSFMHLFGANTIFYFAALCCLFLFLYAIWRMRMRDKATEEDKANFVSTSHEMLIGGEQVVDEQLNK